MYFIIIYIIASSDENPPTYLKIKASIATQFDVENEITGCYAFCKRICKKKKRDEQENLLVKHEDDIIIEEDEFTNWWNKYFLSLEVKKKAKFEELILKFYILQSKSNFYEEADESCPKFNKKFRLKV